MGQGFARVGHELDTSWTTAPLATPIFLSSSINIFVWVQYKSSRVSSCLSGIVSAVRNSGLEIRLLCYDAVEGVPAGVHCVNADTTLPRRKYDQLAQTTPVQLLSDLVRARYLQCHGGFLIDADMIWLRAAPDSANLHHCPARSQIDLNLDPSILPAAREKIVQQSSRLISAHMLAITMGACVYQACLCDLVSQVNRWALPSDRRALSPDNCLGVALVGSLNPRCRMA